MSILLAFPLFLNYPPLKAITSHAWKHFLHINKQATAQVTLSVSPESWKQSCFLPFSHLRIFFPPISPFCSPLFQAVFWFVLNSLNLASLKAAAYRQNQSLNVVFENRSYWLILCCGESAIRHQRLLGPGYIFAASLIKTSQMYLIYGFLAWMKRLANTLFA